MKNLASIALLISCLLLAGCAGSCRDPNARMDAVTGGLLGGPFELLTDITNPQWDTSTADGSSEEERAQIYQEKQIALVYAEIEKSRVVARRGETLRLDEPSDAEYWTMPAWQYPLTY